MVILARGAVAGLLSLGALAGCDPVKSLLESDRPLSIAQTVTVTVEDGHQLRVGISEVTWQDWKRCHDAGGCSFLPRPARRNDARPFPVVGVNRLDVEEFVAWVNSRGGVQYRLPSAAEWSRLRRRIAETGTEEAVRRSPPCLGRRLRAREARAGARRA